MHGSVRTHTHSAMSSVLVSLLLLIALLPTLATASTAVPGDRTRSIQSLAAMALEKTAQARVALKKHHLGKLVQTLREEQLLLDLLAINSPAGEVHSLLHYLRIQMTMEDNREALPDLLPLFHALDRMPPSAKVRQAHGLLKQVKHALEDPDHAKALQLLDSMKKTLEIDTIDLPLQAATDELSHMLNKLQNDHDAPKMAALLLLEKNLTMLLNTG